MRLEAAPLPATAPQPTRSRRGKSRPKQLWITLHLYLGLSLGLLMALLGLTGSLSVYGEELDRLAYPALYAPETAPSDWKPLPVIVEAGSRSAGPGYALRTIEILSASPSTVLLTFTLPDGEARLLHLDRRSAALLGSRPPEQSLQSRLLHWHERLLFPAFGPNYAGVVGLLLAVSLASGLYVWWPAHGRWRQHLSVNRGGSAKRFHYELHRTVGVAAFLVLAVSCVTGIYQAFPQSLNWLAGEETTASENIAASFPAAGGLAETAALALSRFRDAELRSAELLDAETRQYRIILHHAPAIGWRRGEHRLWVDAASGDVVREMDPRQKSAAGRFLGILPAIHSGDALGAAGRALMFLGGLVPSLLFVTGVRLWWLRRRRNGAA
jgi:uncharacterized iron-regulated membrane protein